MLLTFIPLLFASEEAVVGVTLATDICGSTFGSQYRDRWHLCPCLNPTCSISCHYCHPRGLQGHRGEFWIPPYCLWVGEAKGTHARFSTWNATVRITDNLTGTLKKDTVSITGTFRSPWIHARAEGIETATRADLKCQAWNKYLQYRTDDSRRFLWWRWISRS